MRYCNIADPPVYTEEIEHWDRETDADGEAMGGVIEQLVNNDHYHKMSIERLNRVIFVTLPADDWTGDTAPYTQTVEAEGITEDDIPEVYLYYPDSIDETNAEDYVEAYGCINKVETLSNAIKVTAYCDKPSVDITIALRG